MSEGLRVLLDQNVPRSIGAWLSKTQPEWIVQHTSEIGLAGADDREIFDWAQEREAIIVTFDEDFADQRAFPVEGHAGVIRLRVWPTTAEETRQALDRLVGQTTDEELQEALVIVDRSKIRIRSPSQDR